MHAHKCLRTTRIHLSHPWRSANRKEDVAVGRFPLVSVVFPASSGPVWVPSFIASLDSRCWAPCVFILRTSQAPTSPSWPSNALGGSKMTLLASSYLRTSKGPHHLLEATSLLWCQFLGELPSRSKFWLRGTPGDREEHFSSKAVEHWSDSCALSS